MAAQETAIQNNPSRVKRFIREVKAEMKKVSWPNKQELVSYTGVVFVSVLIIGFLIWVVDASFAKVLRAIIK
jgi:preprotein translocase subunit SecE